MDRDAWAERAAIGVRSSPTFRTPTKTMEILSGADTGIDRGGRKIDAIIHLAAIPAPGLYPPSKTFKNNILSEYNIFEAARKLGIRSVVWASSETVLGIPFLEAPPYLPLDEEYEGRPESAYALSKWLGEKMADQFARWQKKDGAKIVGLRFSNVMVRLWFNFGRKEEDGSCLDRLELNDLFIVLRPC